MKRSAISLVVATWLLVFSIPPCHEVTDFLVTAEGFRPGSQPHERSPVLLK